MYSLTDICFLCLLRTNSIKSVLSQDDDGIVVEKKLEFVLSELTNFKPEIPKNICIDCLKGLNYVYKFKQKCLENLSSLSEYLDKSSAERTSNHFLSNFIEEQQKASENRNNSNETVYNNVKDEILESKDPHLLCETQIRENNGEEEIVVKIEPTDFHDESDVQYDSYDDTQIQEDTCYTDDRSDEDIINKKFTNMHNKIDKKYKSLVPRETFTKININGTINNAGKISTSTVNVNEETKKKLHQCSECQKIFGQKSNLTAHIRTHTGEKPYKCDMCDKAFVDTSSLTKHKRTHTGEKPYQCDVCDKAFTERGSLTKHTRIHTGEKPYQCAACDKAFITKSHLMRHCRTHTGEKPYECQLCACKYITNDALKSHIRRRHTNDM